MNMKKYYKSLTKKEFYFRLILLGLTEAFALFSIVYLALNASVDRLLLAIIYLFLALFPSLIELVTKRRLSYPFYLFLSLYMVAVLLGHSYRFYDEFFWWDSMLHACGGFTIALLATYFMDFLNKPNKSTILVKLFFGISMALALSVLWEFIEYGCDHLLKTDMQKDCWVNSIHSYFLGDGKTVGSIEDIVIVSINGRFLPGYLDLGLTDTILDLAMALLGAIVYSLILLIDRRKHPAIRK
ncbi:MAG: hypothetical protein ACOX0I_00890 [Bacilli bacterium]